MSTDGTLDDCGCGAGVTVETPAAIDNRPGLSAIAFRTGTYATFLQSMRASLSSTGRPGLAGLQTRDPSDFSIALLDAFATMADVLTFYQERIANESYIRTATERASLVELCRTIGYTLRPGVAAGTDLAFKMETAAGAPNAAGTPTEVTVPTGTRVQSIPGPGQKPQTFETIEDLDARVEWSTLQPRQTKAQVLKSSSTEVYLQGVATGLKAGDSLLFVGATDPTKWCLRQVAAVTPQPTADPTAPNTQVTLSAKLGKDPASGDAFQVFALRQRAAMFGANAPDWRTMAPSVQRAYLGITDPNGTIPPLNEWPHLNLVYISDAPLATVVGRGLYGEYFNDPFTPDPSAPTDLTKGASTDHLVPPAAFSRTDATVDFDWGNDQPPLGSENIGTDHYSVRWKGRLKAPTTGAYTFSTISDDGVRLWVNGQQLINNWTIHGRTTDTASSAILLSSDQYVDIKLEYFENVGAALIHLSWTGPGITNATVVPETALFSDVYTLQLDGRFPLITPKSWIVLKTPEHAELYNITSADADTRVGYGLSAKTTRLTLDPKNPTNPKDAFNDQVRRLTAFVQSEQLTLADAPDSTPVAKADPIVLDQQVDGLVKGRRLIVSGTIGGAANAQSVVLLSAGPDPTKKLTQLVLDDTTPLQGDYDRSTMLIYANVAAATHGESVGSVTPEVLGSGDASQAYQSFALKQSPLTYVSAAGPSGAASTLTVRVGGGSGARAVTWQEVPALFGHGPRERVYVTSTDDDGTTTVTFGDGITGARLPAGQENVTATYRKGIGTDGLVAANQLSLLLIRPLGIKSVTNPIAPTGAQDRQTADDARQNAPLTVVTLDRIVSLRDYEDFARGFAGIAKALANWTWNGDARGVLLTVAGIAGAAVPAGSQLYQDLVAAIAAAGEPNVPVTVVSYRPATFTLSASIKVESDLVPDVVLASVAGMLTQTFSFDQRAFGQAVARSEVIAAIQAVPGVVMTSLTTFVRTDGKPEQNGYLPADAPRDGSDAKTVLAAELLALDTSPPTLTVIQ